MCIRTYMIIVCKNEIHPLLPITLAQNDAAYRGRILCAYTYIVRLQRALRTPTTRHNEGGCLRGLTRRVPNVLYNIRIHSDMTYGNIKRNVTKRYESYPRDFREVTENCKRAHFWILRVLQKFANLRRIRFAITAIISNTRQYRRLIEKRDVILLHTLRCEK